MGYDVLVVGDYCLDLIFTGLPSLPELGREVVAAGFEQVPGGAFNTAVALHRLGVRVAWATDFGTDAYSQFVLGRARAEGLDERGFVHHARPLRNLTVAASFPQDRAFLAYYDPAPAIPAAAKALAMLRARVLYIPGLYAGPLLDAAMLVVRLKRMTVVMDGNSYESARDELPAPAAGSGRRGRPDAQRSRGLPADGGSRSDPGTACAGRADTVRRDQGRRRRGVWNRIGCGRPLARPAGHPAGHDGRG